MSVVGLQSVAETGVVWGRGRVWQVALIVGAAVSVAYYLPFLPPGGRELIYLASEVAAVALMLAGIVVARPSRRTAWICIGLGMVLAAMGDVTWDWFVLVENSSPSPSLADVFYLAEYVPLLAGVVLVVRGRPDRATVLDTAILTLGLGVVLFELLIQPYLQDSSISPLELLVTVAYPIADLVLIAVIARFALSSGLATAALRLLALGLLLTLAADVVYLLISLADLPLDPVPTDFMFPLSLCLWAAAVWHPSARFAQTVVPQDWLSRRVLRLGLLGLAALLLPASIAAEALIGNYASLPAALAVWIALVAMIVIRMELVMVQANRLEDQLRQAQKMEAIGQLAGGIAHDFNNLLTAIGGYAELLQADMSPSDPAYADTVEIRKASERAAMLTRQLLAFGRRQMLQPQVIDLNGAVDATTRMIRRLIGEHVELQVNLSPGVGLVRVDPGQLAQVLMNLSLNARDAMPDGGRLTIETGSVGVTERQAREYDDLRPGRQALLTVTDTGVGMDAETQSHIFEPFFTTKPAGHGTGLGLATVYGIVRQSEGAILVESRPGQGSSFRVFLPEVHSIETLATSPAAGPTTDLGGAETILVVEDEESVRRLTSSLLSRHGYRVLEAAGPDEAESVVESYTGRINLLVTDVIMPVRNGADLAGRVKAARPGIHVLFMSGYTEDAINHHGVLDEGVAFIQKPFTHEGLLAKVRETLASEGRARG